MQFLKEVHPEIPTFQAGDILIFFQIAIFNRGEETHVSFQRKPSVLEAAAFSILFP
jgi:hypothetical protein